MRHRHDWLAEMAVTQGKDSRLPGCLDACNKAFGRGKFKQHPTHTRDVCGWRCIWRVVERSPGKGSWRISTRPSQGLLHREEWHSVVSVSSATRTKTSYAKLPHMTALARPNSGAFVPPTAWPAVCRPRLTLLHTFPFLITCCKSSRHIELGASSFLLPVARDFGYPRSRDSYGSQSQHLTRCTRSATSTSSRLSPLSVGLSGIPLAPIALPSSWRITRPRADI